MKLAHLSDLHLGKRVNEFSMLEDQRYILNQILEILEEEKPEGVMLCGDIYDRTVPPAEAVELFDRLITRLADAGMAVFIISGNHDSPQRLAFGGELFAARGVYISPVYHGQVEPVELTDSWGKLRIYMLPFIRPAAVAQIFPEEETDTYEKAVGCALSHIVSQESGFDPSLRNVIMAHQFVAGAAVCDSEEMSRGGLDQVSADLFAPFDYVALGHLHGAQSIGRETLRYCGTPLKYSFSESRHVKSVTFAEFGPKGQIQVRTRILKPLRDLRKIRGTYQELTNRAFYQDMNREDYLQITLTDEEDILEALGRLRTIYPNVMQLEYDNQRTRQNHQIPDLPTVHRPPWELFEDLYKLQNNQPMSSRQMEEARAMIEKIWEDNA